MKYNEHTTATIAITCTIQVKASLNSYYTVIISDMIITVMPEMNVKLVL